MEIDKKNRTELKSYFLANKIPTEQNFEDFVDANLNQAEDGIAKVEGNPIALQAEGDTAGTQEILALYSDFTDPKPAWSLNLNPRVDASLPTSNKPGLNITDPVGKTQLFIKAGSGEVGLGTIEPRSRLSIQTAVDASLISARSESAGSAPVFEVKQQNDLGVLNLGDGKGGFSTQLSGGASQPNFFLSKVGVGTSSPQTALHVSGKDAELRVSNSENGNSPHLTLEGSNGKAWDITSDESQGNELHLRPTGNGEKGIKVKRDGSLHALGGVNFGERSDHLAVDGSIYRLGGQLHLAVNDNFFIRDIGGSEKIHFNTNNGRVAIGGKNPAAPLTIHNSGKFQSPNGAMHLSNDAILFGGPNTTGRATNSAQIAAGKFTPNSLNIVGMASGASASTRKVEIWAEGGLKVNGPVIQTKVVAFSAYITSNSLTNNRNPVSFGHLERNMGNGFNLSTNSFTAPVKGIYMLTMSLHKVGSGFLEWLIRLNTSRFVNGASGSETAERARMGTKYDTSMVSKTIVTQLNVGDKIHIQQLGSGRPDNYRSCFEGVLIHAI